MCKLCKDCVSIKHIKKRVKLSLNPLILLVAGVGFEPTTFRL